MGNWKQRICTWLCTLYNCIYLSLPYVREIELKNDWIMGVLTDLSEFARKNGMDVLAEQLDETRLLAAIELTAPKRGTRTHDGAAEVASEFIAERSGERL